MDKKVAIITAFLIGVLTYMTATPIYYTLTNAAIKKAQITGMAVSNVDQIAGAGQLIVVAFAIMVFSISLITFWKV